MRNFGLSRTEPSLPEERDRAALWFSLGFCFSPFAAVALAVLAYGWWEGLFA